MKNFGGLLLLFLSFQVLPAYSQRDLSADSLFTLARQAAFNDSNYPRAIHLAKSSLAQQENEEVRTFLGRVYSWSKKADSARWEFERVLTRNPKNAEALAARSDVELWDGKPAAALKYAELGAQFYPESSEFVIRQMRAYEALNRIGLALHLGNKFLSQHSSDSLVLAERRTLKDEHPQNAVTMNHSYIKFDERFDEPWNLTVLAYERRTRFGSVIGNVNRASRFGQAGLEAELQNYASITKSLYTYLSAAASGSGIFPDYRLGVSVYKGLPAGFEIEAGVRYLKFTEGTTVLVAGVGKYHGKNFYSARAFITPASGSAPTISGSLSARFFTGIDRYDSFGIQLVTGTSPDDRARDILIANNLQSVKIGLDYSVNIFRRTTLGLLTSWAREEYLTDTFGNQFTLGASLSQRF